MVSKKITGRISSYISNYILDTSSELENRIITAVILILISTLCVAKGGLLMYIFLSGIFAVALGEAENIITKAGIRKTRAKFLFAMYFSVVILILSSIRESNFGCRKLLLLILIIVSTDIGAFFAGRKLGKRKILPSISPSKTYEGLIGGIVLGLITSQVLGVIFDLGLNLKIMIISVLISVLSQIGDFTESYFKRLAGLKDSGSLLKGHGGVLDRFDGFIFTVPFFYIIINIFNIF